MAKSETINSKESGKVVASDGDCRTSILESGCSAVKTNVNMKKAEEISSNTMREKEEGDANSLEAANQTTEANIQVGGEDRKQNHQKDQCQPVATKCERPSPVKPPLPPKPAKFGDGGISVNDDDAKNDINDDQEANLPIDETKAADPSITSEATAAQGAVQSIVGNGDGEIGNIQAATDDATEEMVDVKLNEEKLLEDASMDRDLERKVPPKIMIPLDQYERKQSIVIDKNGWIRHIIAVLALSSIVLANMNRQVFNQSLASMTMGRTTPATAASDLSGPIEHDIIPPIAFADPPSAMNLNYTASDNQNVDSAAPTVDSTTTALRQDREDIAPAAIPFSTAAVTTTTTTTSDSMTTIAGETTTNFTPQMPSVNPMEAQDRFNWTKSQISVLQAAFSYGYMPFMIPGGRMAELYGAKWVVFVSGFGSALCCAITPLVADSYYLLVVSRIIMGISQTAVSPALYALLTRWLAPDESSVYLPMIKVGVVLGFAIGSLSSGLLSWRMAFYMTGFVGFLWCLLWFFMVTSDPAEHRLVSETELEYIEQEIRCLNKGRKQSAGTSRKAPAPWLRILTNPVILSFMAAKFTVKLSTDAQTTQLPMYLEQVFHVSKGTNASIVAANFVIQCIFTGLVAWAAKECVVKGPFGLNKTGVRRLFQGVCNFGMGISYLMLTFDMSSLNLAIFAVVVLAFTSMFGSGGEAVLPIDLSVEYSASIMAIANSVANLSGIVLPTIVKFILSYSDNNWAMVWWFVGAIIVLGGFTFVFGVEAEVQDFRSPQRTGNKTIQNKEPEKCDSLDNSGNFTKIDLTVF